MDQTGSALWMNVTDVFHIRGRGTVLTGRLDGQGQLNVGDYAVCEAGTWPVIKIEAFRATLETAAPGMDIGILLGSGPPTDRLRTTSVYFQPGKQGQMGPQQMGPQFTGIPQKKRRWGR